MAAVKQQTGAYVQFTRPGTATNNYKDRMMIVVVDSVEMLQDALRFLFDAVAAVSERAPCVRACVRVPGCRCRSSCSVCAGVTPSSPSAPASLAAAGGLTASSPANMGGPPLPSLHPI